MRAKREIDLLVDPAPDLVVEAETSRSLLDRLSILAALGVGEAWRFDGKKLTILARTGKGRVVEQARSRCFPWLPIDQFVLQLEKADATDETTWIRSFRVWVRESLKSP